MNSDFLHNIRVSFEHLIDQLTEANTELVVFAVLIICAVVVLEGASIFARKKRKETGIAPSLTTLSLDGSKTLPVRHYVSDMQGLAGRPDALISENGYIIPVEHKPLSNKVRDRYIAQVLVYMRLVEEFEGKKPPYGYLILGKNCRKFKVENSPERQAWLQKMINEMQGILHGAASVPTPHEKKCKRCDVRASCAFKIDEVVKIQRSAERN